MIPVLQLGKLRLCMLYLCLWPCILKNVMVTFDFRHSRMEDSTPIHPFLDFPMQSCKQLYILPMLCLHVCCCPGNQDTSLTSLWLTHQHLTLHLDPKVQNSAFFFFFFNFQNSAFLFNLLLSLRKLNCRMLFQFCNLHFFKVSSDPFVLSFS